MNRFFQDEASVDGSFHISGENHKHIKNVLRMKVGEQIELCVANKTYLCEIVEINKDEVIADIVDDSLASNELKTHINIFQGLPKKEKMELVIQKSVELGAYGIYPVLMDRCIVKYDAKKSKSKLDRWNKIALSASMQSKRDMIVPVYDIAKLSSYEEKFRTDALTIVLYEDEDNYTSLKSFLQEIGNYDTINVIIGAEGGISEDEIAYLKSLGAKTMSLGRRTLRTETAGLMFLSCAGAFLEE